MPPHPYTSMALPHPVLARKLVLDMMSKSTNHSIDYIPSHLSTSSSSSQSTQGFYLLSPYHSTKTHTDLPTIITFTALFITFSLLGFFSVYLRRCYTLRHINSAVPIGNHPPLPSHQGLHPLILQTLPYFTFSSSSSSSSSPNSKKEKKRNECAICLEEFGDEETVRLLPPCGHIFHSQCIHMWFFSHTTCPLCRHSLLPSHHNSTGVEGERESSAQNSYTQETSVDMEAPSQSVTLQMDDLLHVIECKEAEPSVLNIALKPKKPKNAALRRSCSMGRCLMMKEEGEGSQSRFLNAINMKIDEQLRRSSVEVLSDESLLPHRHPVSSEHWKGKDAKIGRSRSFCFKFVKPSTSDTLKKRRFDDGECPPSSSSSSSSAMQPISSSVKKRTLTRFLSAKEPFYCQPNKEQ